MFCLLKRAAATAAASRGSASALAADGASPGEGEAATRADAFAVDYTAWILVRGGFLRRASPSDAVCAPLVAPGARTGLTVPPAVRAPWRELVEDALEWARREPEQRHVWAWLLLLPCSRLQVPSRQRSAGSGAATGRAPLPLAVRAAALLSGDFMTARHSRKAAPRHGRRTDRSHASY